MKICNMVKLNKEEVCHPEAEGDIIRWQCLFCFKIMSMVQLCGGGLDSLVDVGPNLSPVLSKVVGLFAP